MQGFITTEEEVLRLVGDGIKVKDLKGTLLGVAQKLAMQPERRNQNPKLLACMVQGEAGYRKWPTRKGFINNPGMEY
jgi:hypothetical protein